MKVRKKTILKIILLQLILIISLIFFLNKYSFAVIVNNTNKMLSNVAMAVAENFHLNAVALPEENNNHGAVSLDWSSYGDQNVIFKGYQKREGTEEWNSFSILNYETIDEVKLLQVYPDTGAGQLRSWLVDSGYGQGLISVDEVSITNFNNNPTAYLKKDASGSYNYDVIFFGTWDRNNCRDLSTASYNVVDQYIEAGYGCIFGHDTILNNATFVNDTRETNGGPVKQGQTNFDNLAKKYFKSLYLASTQNNQINHGGTEVQIVKSGLFTTYPWHIGDVGDKLTVPNCHTWGQGVTSGYEDNVWLRFTAWGADDPTNFFLITENNVAMIQTGHSNGTATADEQKILANLVFSSYQISSDTSTVDRSAMDYNAPDKPTVNFEPQADGINVTFSSKDNGTNYTYRIDAFNKDNYNEPINSSDMPTVNVMSGFSNYYYVVDTNPENNFDIAGATSTTTGAIKLGYADNGTKYVHIKAADKAGNVSEVSTLPIRVLSNVKLNPNEGTIDGSGEVKTVTGLTGKEVLTLGTPQRTGYTFTGWYSDPGCTTRVTTADNTQYTPMQLETTLYAGWQVNSYGYKIDYYYDNTKESTIEGTAEYGTTIQNFEPREKSGYEFSSKTNIPNNRRPEQKCSKHILCKEKRTNNSQILR